MENINFQAVEFGSVGACETFDGYKADFYKRTAMSFQAVVRKGAISVIENSISFFYGTEIMEPALLECVLHSWFEGERAPKLQDGHFEIEALFIHPQAADILQEYSDEPYMEAMLEDVVVKMFHAKQVGTLEEWQFNQTQKGEPFIPEFLIGKTVAERQEFVDACNLWKPEKVKLGLEEGEVCNREGCSGVIANLHDDGSCCCHATNPPCSWCTSSHYACPVCGWDERDGEPESSQWPEGWIVFEMGGGLEEFEKRYMGPISLLQIEDKATLMNLVSSIWQFGNRQWAAGKQAAQEELEMGMEQFATNKDILQIGRLLLDVYTRSGLFVMNCLPESTVHSCLQKLIIEAKEAQENPDDKKEWADVLISLFAAIYMQDAGLLEVMGEAVRVVEGLPKRKWEKQADGTYQSQKLAPGCSDDTPVHGAECPKWDSPLAGKSVEELVPIVKDFLEREARGSRWQRFKCWMGIHTWETQKYHGGSLYVEKCKHCPQLSMWDGDTHTRHYHPSKS